MQILLTLQLSHICIKKDRPNMIFINKDGKNMELNKRCSIHLFVL
nr:MAG TPA: hypothetical protein [Caudoviricetes sp.]